MNIGQFREFGLCHLRDQLVKLCSRLPTQNFFGLAGVAHQSRRFGWTHHAGIVMDKRSPIQLNGGEGRFHDILHAMQLTGSKNKVFRSVVIQGHPHTANVIGGVAPVAQRGRIAEA